MPADPAASIVRSKVQPPSLRPSTLERRRLLDRLEGPAGERVVLVAAEAGYGKTTLIADFARRASAACYWYRLETSDRDWVTYLNYLVAAVREVEPGFGPSTEALLRQYPVMGPSMEVVLATFLSELESLPSAPAIFIFDDFHLVDDSPDVRAIMRRLFERAPRATRFVIATRVRPDLHLGRIAARGDLIELSTDDLRFGPEEIRELFSSVYDQPLESDVYRIIEERTEGWAASLQLVSTSIRTRGGQAEVRAFIRELSGAQGPIYDFLAEEVLAYLPGSVQSVLLHASLLDLVDPALVAAAMSAGGEPVSDGGVMAALQEAESLGLIGRPNPTTGSRRLHPLLRGFLRRELENRTPPPALGVLRHAIAAAAEERDWLTAARQYAEVPAPGDVIRVLSKAAIEAMGTGFWGAASELLGRLPTERTPPLATVLRARSMTSSGNAEEALQLLDELSNTPLPPRDQLLAGLARLAALHVLGRLDDLWAELEVLSSIAPGEQELCCLIQGWHDVVASYRGASLAVASKSMLRLADEMKSAGLAYYAGVSLHNAATMALAQAEYQRVRNLSDEAIGLLSASDAGLSLVPSTSLLATVAEIESGDWRRGIGQLRTLAFNPQVQDDVLAEASYVFAAFGHVDEAAELLERLGRRSASESLELGVSTIVHGAKVAVLLATGSFAEAARLSSSMGPEASDGVDGYARSAFLRAECAHLSGAEASQRLASEAIRLATDQAAWRWEYRSRIIDAATRGDTSELGRRVTEASRLSRLALLETADTVASALHLVDPLPDELINSITAHHQRWLPALARQLEQPESPSAAVAAVLVAEYGTAEYLTRLHAFESSRVRGVRRRELGRRLVNRVSPTLRIHDLGRTSFEVGDRAVRLSDTRRRAAELLMYLTSRTGQTATREQVMDELWPDLGPAAAANSLHQTLYFLRHEINPWHGEGFAADYIPMDSEVIYLDPALVQVDSVAFMRQVGEATTNSDPVTRLGPEVLRLYRGRFAPEFEYEEWAEDWRSIVHTAFLRLAHVTATALLAEKKSDSAVDVLSRAVSLDSHAYELGGLLVRALHASGARDAAVQRHRVWAQAYQDEYGVPAPAIDTVVDGSWSAGEWT